MIGMYWSTSGANAVNRSPIVSTLPPIEASPPRSGESSIVISSAIANSAASQTSWRYLRRQYQSRRRDRTSWSRSSRLGAVERGRRDQPVGEHVDQPAEGGDAEQRAEQRPADRPVEAVVQQHEQRRAGERSRRRSRRGRAGATRAPARGSAR